MRASGSAVSSSMLLLALAGAAAAAAAQDVVPGARSELVRLDVVVTDSHGKPVRDLTVGDFQLLEDGKPQHVTHFAVADRRGPLPESQPGAEAAAVPAIMAPAAPPSGDGRLIVVFIDDLHMQGDNLVFAKQALHRFADEIVSAEDGVALVTTSGPGGTERFTRDRAAFRQAIDSLVARDSPVQPAQGSQMTPAQAELVLRGDSSALKLAARTLMETPGTGYNPGDVPRGDSGRLIMGGVDREERPAAEEAQRQAVGILVETLRRSTVTLDRLSDVVRGLSSLPGRKLCLLVSDGFLVGAGTTEERTRDMQGVIDAATRAGAVVYALDSRGLVTTAGDASAVGGRAQPNLHFRVESGAQQLYLGTLMSLANDTGGFVVRGTNDLAGGLRRMLEDNEAYYLLAYEPASTKRDGRFRKIEVRLPRGRGYVVRTRKGYFAPDDRKRAPHDLMVAARPLDEGEVRAILSASPPKSDIPVRLAADYLDLPQSGPQAVVRAHVDLSALRWQDASGRRQASLDVWGGVFDANGKAVGAPFGRHASLDLSADEHRRATREGFQYRQQIPLAPGRYEIRWVAAESHMARLGGSSQWLEIPDLGEKKLAMSGVFLSSSSGTGGQANGGGTGGGESLRVVDALHRFKRDEGLYFQVYVYNPATDEKGSSEVVFQAQIWSKGKVVAASKPRPASLQSKDGVPVPETNGMSLQELTPGDYALKVVVVDRKANATLARSVDFTVE